MQEIRPNQTWEVHPKTAKEPRRARVMKLLDNEVELLFLDHDDLPALARTLRVDRRTMLSNQAMYSLCRTYLPGPAPPTSDRVVSATLKTGLSGIRSHIGDMGPHDLDSRAAMRAYLGKPVSATSNLPQVQCGPPRSHG